MHRFIPPTFLLLSTGCWTAGTVPRDCSDMSGTYSVAYTELPSSISCDTMLSNIGGVNPPLLVLDAQDNLSFELTNGATDLIMGCYTTPPSDVACFIQNNNCQLGAGETNCQVHFNLEYDPANWSVSGTETLFCTHEIDSCESIFDVCGTGQ